MGEIGTASATAVPNVSPQHRSGGLGSSTVPGYIRRLTGLLHLSEVAPAVRLRSIEVGKPVDLRQPSARKRLASPAGSVRVRRKRRNGATDEAWRFRDGEVGRLGERVVPVLLRDTVMLEH